MTETTRMRAPALLWGLALALAVGIAAPASAKTFRYSTQGDFLGFDPHINNDGPTNAMKNNIFEGLLYRAPDLSIHPALATAWRQVDRLTWRFDLRRGVTFHDGTPFTADDVIFSFERVTREALAMTFSVGSVKEIRRIDDHAIDIVTKAPDPILLQSLTSFYVMSRKWSEANGATHAVVGAATTSPAGKAANGTGPFRVVERVPDTRTVVEPYPGWWGKATHNLTRAVFTPIRNSATRVAALLSDEIDMMYPVPLQDMERIQQSGSARVLQGPELRVIFFGLDQFREEMIDMPGSGKNPLTDIRVRRAIAMAIDAQAIRRVVMRGASVPIGLLVAPGIEGYDKALDVRPPFDPEGAKKLLAEAGWPNGFPITLDCPNDRYINDEAICVSMVPMLKRVGIDLKLNLQARSLHFDKIGQKGGRNTSFYMLGWTPATFDALNAISILFTLGPLPSAGVGNNGRYMSPRVEELAVQANVEMDPVKRRAMLHEMLKILRDDVALIPLHQQALAWAVRSSVAEIAQRPTDDVDLRTVVMK